MSDEIRRDIEAAIEQNKAAAEPAAVEAEAAELEAEAPAADAAADESESGEGAVPPGEKPQESEKPAPDGRDEKGRFAPKPKAAATAAPKATDKLTTPPARAPVLTPNAPPPGLGEHGKPPASWNPLAREKWGTLPPDVRQEVVRRDREAAVAIKESAQHRQFVQAFQREAAPYEQMFRVQGTNPIQAAASLFRNAAILQTGHPQQKAQLVAQMIQENGIPVEALASALDRQPQARAQQQQFDPNTIAQQVKQAVLSQIQGERQQVHRERAQTELQDFAAENEFFEDVREEMAHHLQVAAMSGRPLTMKQAYDYACSQHPQINAALQQRKAVQQANATQASTQRAKAAGSTVRTNPAGPLPQEVEPDDIVADLKAAIRQHK